MLAVLVLLSSVVNINAQIKNKKQKQLRLFGNCDMCKTNIEKAGNIRKPPKLFGIKTAEWQQ
jgi:hypothetical protein